MCPFLTAQSLDGEVFLFSFRHLSNCKLMVLSATSRAFLHHTHTNTEKQTDGCIWLHSCPVSTPSPLCDITCFGSCDLALYRLWALWFWIAYPVSICVHYRCSTSTTSEANGDDTISSNVTIFRPFLTWKKHNTYGCFIFFFFLFVLFLSLPFTEDQMLLSQASRDLKLIFSPLLMNAKIIYNVTWRRESCIALSINFLSVKKRSLYASTATWRNAMYVFGSAKKANHRVII